MKINIYTTAGALMVMEINKTLDEITKDDVYEVAIEYLGSKFFVVKNWEPSTQEEIKRIEGMRGKRKEFPLSEEIFNVSHNSREYLEAKHLEAKHLEAKEHLAKLESYLKSLENNQLENTIMAKEEIRPEKENTKTQMETLRERLTVANNELSGQNEVLEKKLENFIGRDLELDGKPIKSIPLNMDAAESFHSLSKQLSYELDRLEKNVHLYEKHLATLEKIF